jgi:hypothetical protein
MQPQKWKDYWEDKYNIEPRQISSVFENVLHTKLELKNEQRALLKQVRDSRPK